MASLIMQRLLGLHWHYWYPCFPEGCFKFWAHCFLPEPSCPSSSSLTHWWLTELCVCKALDSANAAVPLGLLSGVLAVMQCFQMWNNRKILISLAKGKTIMQFQCSGPMQSVKHSAFIIPLHVDISNNHFHSYCLSRPKYDHFVLL